MNGTILIGQGRRITAIPRGEWEKGVSRAEQRTKARLSFMSEEHHRVRYFVVRELPNVGEPMSPEFIGQELNLPTARVNDILEDLEKHLTFLFRNEQGEVVWAYPVTVDSTPHRITLSTGEKLHAA
jgi:hypothetical protein